MELHRVPNGTKVRVITPESPPPAGISSEAGEEYYFDHIDGMYSLCFDRHGNRVHLKAWTEVEIVE